jgi:hypothetical protein
MLEVSSKGLEDKGLGMAKAQSTAIGATYNADTKTLTVEVHHAPQADYTRSVRRSAWKLALTELRKLPFVVRNVESTLEFVNTWTLSDSWDGQPCTTLVHYRIVN